MTDLSLRVFVSSKMQELAPEREAVAEALRPLHVKAWVFEKDAGARPGTIQETYLEELEGADLYIGIFWKGYGAYTIEEYEQAQLLGMDCLVYEKSATPGDPRDPALQAFLDRIGGVTAGVTVQRFQSASQLRELVADHVAQWQARIIRDHAARPPAIYAGVPHMPPQFIGRCAPVQQLVTRLRAREDVAVDGLPGVGKTSLAVALTRHPGVRRYFRDGILWASLGPRAAVGDVLARWARELKIDVADGTTDAERAQALTDAIGGRHMLLVIDDVWELAAAKTLRCGGPNCAHVLTTRDKAIARGFAGPAQAQTLPILDGESGEHLLQAIAPAACKADPHATRKLLATAGGLPLAIRLLGGYLESAEHALFPDLFSDLKEEAFADLLDPIKRLQLAETRLGSREPNAATFEDTVLLSLEGLPDEFRQTFFALGAFEPMPARFSRAAAEAVTGASARTLAVLAARNVLEIQGDTLELALHQTISDVARLQCDASAVRRHHDFYFAILAEGRNRYDRWFVADHFLQIGRAWSSAPDDERLLDDLFVLRPFFVQRDAWHEYFEWAQRALRCTDDAKLAHRRAALVADIGLAQYSMRDWTHALETIQSALPAFEALGDRRGYARALHNCAMCEYSLGKSDSTLLRAVALLGECGDKHGTLIANMNLRSLREQAENRLDTATLGARATVSRGEWRLEEWTTTDVHLAPIPALSGKLHEQPLLLALAETALPMASKPADFAGHLVLVVSRAEGRPPAIWEARFEPGKWPVTGFLRSCPMHADALVTMTERDADAILERGSPGKTVVVEGDRDLVGNFGRYLGAATVAVPSPRELEAEEARRLYALAESLESNGQRSLAIDSFKRAVEIERCLIAHGGNDIREALAKSLLKLGDLLWAEGRRDDALNNGGEAIGILRELIEQNGRVDLMPNLVMRLRWRALLSLSMATSVDAAAKAAEANKDLTAVIDLGARSGPSNVFSTVERTQNFRYRGLARSVTGDVVGAADDYSRTVDLDRERLAGGDDNAAVELADDLFERARVRERLSLFELAAHDVEESAACYRELVEKQGRGDLRERLGEVSWMATGFTVIQQRAAQWKAFIDRAMSIYSDLFHQEANPQHLDRLLDCLRNRAGRSFGDGQFAEALADCDKAIEIATPLLPTTPDAIKAALAACLNLASWIRATSPDHVVRDGVRAIDLARRACEITNWNEYQVFDTLAAAYAEAGDFDHAIEWQRSAMEHATAEEMEAFKARLEQYRAKQPYRDRRSP